MQAKRHLTKLIKFSSKLPSWKTLMAVKLDRITVTKILRSFRDFSGQTDVGNEEVDLRKKNLLSWQNILNSRQIQQI